MGVDARNRPEDLADVPRLVAELRRSGIGCEVLFLRADNETLLKRFSETRRRHPLSRSGLGLQEALEQEQRLLAPVANAADLTVDTSRLSVHELRELIRERVVERKAGRPVAAVPVVRLPARRAGRRRLRVRRARPAESLLGTRAARLHRPRRGRGRAVHVAARGGGALPRRTSRDFLERWLPSLVRSNRSYLTVAVGCTGGQHRSVYLAEKLAAHFNGRFGRALIRHRDLASRRHE